MGRVRMMRHLMVIAVIAALAIPLFASMAAAAPPPFAGAPMSVSLTVDHDQLTVDLDADGHPLTPAALTYEVTVTNQTDDLVPAVAVRCDLPHGLKTADGQPVRLDVGDMGAGSVWRGTFTVEVDHTALDGPSVETVAVAATGDGAEVPSAPAATDVRVISATTIERAPEVTPTPAPQAVPQAAPAPTAAPAATPAPAAAPAAQSTPTPVAPRVLGVTYTRFDDGTVAATLPRTGSSPGLLALAGLLFVIAGSLLTREGTA